MDRRGEKRASRNEWGEYGYSKWDELRDAKNEFFDRVSGRGAERREREAEVLSADDRCWELREIGGDFVEKMQNMRLRGTEATMAELLEGAMERNDIRMPERLIRTCKFWGDLEMLDEVNAGMIKEKDVAALAGGRVDPREMKLAFREVRRFADEARREAGLGKATRPAMSREEAERLAKRMKREETEFVDADTAWQGAGYVFGDELVAHENLFAMLNLEKLSRVGGGFTEAYEAASDAPNFGRGAKREMVSELRAQLSRLSGDDYADFSNAFEALADNYPSPFVDDLLSIEVPGSRRKRYVGVGALTARKLNGQPLLSDEQVTNVLQWYNHAVAAERKELAAECAELEDDYVEGVDMAVARGLLPKKFRSAANAFRKGARGQKPSTYHLADPTRSERGGAWDGMTFYDPGQSYVDIFLDMRLAADSRRDHLSSGSGSRTESGSGFGFGPESESGSGSEENSEYRKAVLMHEMTHNIAGQNLFQSREVERIVNEALTENIATIILEAGEEHRYGGGDYWMGRDLWEGATGRKWGEFSEAQGSSSGVGGSSGYSAGFSGSSAERARADASARRSKDVRREPTPYRFGSGTTYPSERETLRFLQSQGRCEISSVTFYDAYVGEPGDGSKERLYREIRRAFPELRSMKEMEDFIFRKHEEIRRRNAVKMLWR